MIVMIMKIGRYVSREGDFDESLNLNDVESKILIHVI